MVYVRYIKKCYYRVTFFISHFLTRYFFYNLITFNFQVACLIFFLHIHVIYMSELILFSLIIRAIIRNIKSSRYRCVYT